MRPLASRVTAIKINARNERCRCGAGNFCTTRAVNPASDAFAHEVGHEIKLLNFNRGGGNGDDDDGGPVQLKMMEFARNASGDQAFIATNVNGFNRPTNIRFGPDACAWIADYGAVRDPGTDTHFAVPADGPLVQIPHTGVVWRICPK